jgi:hypothetical protein
MDKPITAFHVLPQGARLLSDPRPGAEGAAVNSISAPDAKA